MSLYDHLYYKKCKFKYDSYMYDIRKDHGYCHIGKSV